MGFVKKFDLLILWHCGTVEPDNTSRPTDGGEEEAISVQLSGTTTMLGLIGTPVAHSKSPAMYNHCFARYGLDWAYLAFDVTQEKAGAAVQAIRTLHMRGTNVTMPCKNAVIPYLDRLSPEARAIGAVNVIINDDGVLLAFLPFPPFEKVVKVKGQKGEKMHFTPAAIVLVCLGFTTSTTFMLWMNCNQELGALYGLADPSKIQSFYSVGIVVALFVSAALLKRNVEPAKTLVIYPCVALATLAAIYFIQKPVMCLAGGFLLGFFAAGGVLQLVTAVANEMFPRNRGVITSIVMISSSVANYIVISVAGVLTRVGGVNGPRLVVLFNMAVTLVGILLAVYPNICQKRERAAQVK